MPLCPEQNAVAQGLLLTAAWMLRLAQAPCLSTNSVVQGLLLADA